MAINFEIFVEIGLGYDANKLTLGNSQSVKSLDCFDRSTCYTIHFRKVQP